MKIYYKKDMPRKSKDIGVIIEFDDKEYSYEETSLLWARLYSVFARIAEKEIPVEFIQKVFSPDFCKELDSKMDSNSENS